MRGFPAVALALLTCLATAAAERSLEPTPDVGAGPNHKSGAPYRAKLSPPLAEGTVIVIKGHVRASDTGDGLSGIVLDAFHSDARGKYDMKGYDYRARVLTDESGYFEFETIHPQSYGPPPHIHFVISGDGYRTLRTTLELEGDLEEGGRTEHGDGPVIGLVSRRVAGGSYEEGTFDIVLTPDR